MEDESHSSLSIFPGPFRGKPESIEWQWGTVPKMAGRYAIWDGYWIRLIDWDGRRWIASGYKSKLAEPWPEPLAWRELPARLRR